MAKRGELKSISTAYSGGAILAFSTLTGNKLPGFITSTADTYINYPIDPSGGDISFVIIYDGPTTVAASGYPAVSIQKRPSSQGGYYGSTMDSTMESAFERIYSTSVFVATTIQAEAFLLGPLNVQKYGCNYLGTSSNEVDQYQSFIRMMVGYSTVAGGPGATGIGCTHDALSTSLTAGVYYILPIQIGSTHSS